MKKTAMLQLQDSGVSVEKLARVFQSLADVSAKIPMPDMQSIAGMRISMLYKQQGIFCVFHIRFWQWIKLYFFHH